MEQLRLEGVTKRYGSVTAVDNIFLSVERGEFITLLGPSGCGKTTTLRMIGGLEEPTSGVIYIQGSDVTRVPAFKRPTNMVFQSYALFPHLSVFNNIVFGLKNMKVPKEIQREKADRMLTLVQLKGLEDRRPNELSGGQQQRVALARALINEPAVLLLDEPLGALDAKLRKEMRFELKRIQHELGVSFIFVTHDQEEAISLSDRIVLMNDGEVQQEGTPRDIFESPANQFVADFVGVGNSVSGQCVERTNGSVLVKCLGGSLVTVQSDEAISPGDAATVWVRATDVKVGSGLNGDEGQVWQGRIGQLLYYGDQVDLVVLVSGDVGDEEFRTVISAEQFYADQLDVGSEVEIGWETDKGRLFVG